MYRYITTKRIASGSPRARTWTRTDRRRHMRTAHARRRSGAVTPPGWEGGTNKQNKHDGTSTTPRRTITGTVSAVGAPSTRESPQPECLARISERVPATTFKLNVCIMHAHTMSMPRLASAARLRYISPLSYDTPYSLWRPSPRPAPVSAVTLSHSLRSKTLLLAGCVFPPDT